MTHSTWIYIIIMIITTNLIRVIPLTLIRGQIKNRFVQSFLYYVPYVTLAVMTFPAIMEATNSPVAGAVALILGIIAAFSGLGLFPVSIICCVVVFILEFFL
ncbi:MAG: AzlD domain-containing protein [Lachnospiraceae bacterium]|nr:AzlD domain-containing protein [Lachnospiraceae bacterium]